jgi:ATP-dependent Lon protease
MCTLHACGKVFAASTWEKNMKKDVDLSCIRIGTEDDLADAMALASRLLDDTSASLDFVTRQFSLDLLVAVLLTTAYGKRDKTLAEVLFFLVDPAWDCAKQILLSFPHDREAFQQKNAALWRNGLAWKIMRVADDAAQVMVNRCYLHWKNAFAMAGGVEVRAKPPSRIAVFNQQAVAKAVQMVSSLPPDKKAGAERILQNAQANDGYRLVPDACQARARLEEAKARFENLVAPITRLQIDLFLAAAMDAENFHINPILLLGDPGIGKTYLATQLAEALGVATEKISAGGAQGGFQFTGSHTSWMGARPGSLFTLLAEGGCASPVVVIDEIDKIGASAQFPVLPVLLDLLEPNTAQRFKDQFFDMEFDASRMIFILTANSLDGVPAALLSRVEVFEVPRPEPVQRLRIIEQVTDQLCLKTKTHIAMDKGTCDLLAERMDIDLRRLSRLVTEAFAKAMQLGKPLARIVIPQFSGKRSIGF